MVLKYFAIRFAKPGRIPADIFASYGLWGLPDRVVRDLPRAKGILKTFAIRSAFSALRRASSSNDSTYHLPASGIAPKNRDTSIPFPRFFVGRDPFATRLVVTERFLGATRIRAGTALSALLLRFAIARPM